MTLSFTSAQAYRPPWRRRHFCARRRPGTAPDSDRSTLPFGPQADLVLAVGCLAEQDRHLHSLCRPDKIDEIVRILRGCVVLSEQLFRNDHPGDPCRPRSARCLHSTLPSSFSRRKAKDSYTFSVTSQGSAPASIMSAAMRMLLAVVLRVAKGTGIGKDRGIQAKGDVAIDGNAQVA